METNKSLPALLALSLGYFGMGTASLAVVGLGAPMGDSLHVPDARIGLMVTVFALTFAIAAPTAPMLLARVDRKRVLLIGLGLLTLGEALCAVVPDYTTLAVARVVAALGSAVFAPAASATGAAIVPAERRQAALATVFGGMTIAAVLGVPLSSYLGSTLGWRPALFGVAVLTALSFVLVAVLVPPVAGGERPTAAAYRQALRTPAAMSTVLTTLLFMAAQFTVYGIASTFLTDRFGVGSTMVSATLLAFGVIGVIGNASGPRIVTRIGGVRTITLSVAGMGIAFVLLLLAPHARAGVALFVAWAFFSQVYQAPQQGRLVALLPEQPALILALNASALYLGMSLGSTIGSALLPDLGARPIPAFGLVLVALAGAAHAASARRAAAPAAAVEAGPRNATTPQNS
ncbi:MFS transporter [Streptomyces spiralis]|uniref:MFS transporter n=1 Tax=Streptomyces sp. NRRL S-813 TaxID=1463919 RepID=UPI0004BFA3BA|nr:MFS transporter [Streptomyces sp. NRRL S-813]